MRKAELKSYQARAIEYARANPYSILALDPGLGKSRCAIEIRKEYNTKCIIVCPSYLGSNWVKEISKWDETANVYLMRSGKGAIDPSQYDFNYLIASYDMIQKAEHFFDWADMVVLDEAHAIKSMTAKRTQYLHRVIYENSVPRLLLLTGTPIKNRVKEFYSLLATCYYSPKQAKTDFFDRWPSEIDFADEFSFRKSFEITLPNGFPMTITQWHGIQNTPELKKYLNNKYIRVRSVDVLDLPPIMEKSFQISDTDDERLRTAFDNYFYSDIFDLRSAKEKDRKERVASTLPEHKAIAALKKVPFTIKYVENLLEETDCVLVYSDHIAPAQKIASHFKVEALTGLMPSGKRSQLADDFQNGKGKILVCTVGAMKEGKDLFRANHLVFNDFPWVPGDLKQVIYRIQRIGQTKTCMVHRIVGSPQDGYIMDTIKEKMEVIEKAT